MAGTLLPLHVLEDLVEHAKHAPAGAFAEFGVFQGGSAYFLNILAKKQGRELYLFDTFAGMPVSGPLDQHPVGDFADTSLEAVRALIPDAHFVVGTFPESAAGLELPPLAFVHVDADQYESLKAAIDYFPPRMVPGGVMIFDDYLCLEGATKAIEEWGAPFEVTKAEKALWRKP